MTSTPATLINGIETPASARTGQHHHHHPLNGAGKRIRHFLRPDGRQVHIAGNPDEARRMSETLRMQEISDIDLVVHGSREHIEALRHTHSHHEERHRQLKEEHPDLAAEFEHVLRELDALSAELHMISEHAVQLDANFSKYGYSAHLRTRDSGDEDGASSGGSTFDKETWHAGRKLGETIRFYQKPIVRQYFHKGLLWRAREAQEVASYELFIDLFYVGIIAITGDTAAEHPDGTSLLRFVITFIMGWKFWTDISLLISWFDSDDVLRRCSVLFALTCLLGFTTNMVDAFEHTYTPLVAFYVTARLYLILSLFWYGYQIPMVRGSMIGNGIIALIPVALWIGSIHVEDPGRQGLIWIAILFDLFGGMLMVTVQRPGLIQRNLPSSWKERLEFFPGTNIEHRIERTNAFVTLVFGSCVLGILYQSSAVMSVNAFFGKAVLGLIQAFTFNWIYFEIDSFNLHTHAIRRHVLSAMIWFSIHLPFVMSFVLSAGALAVLVRAHDCPDADVESLFETFVPRSEDHISAGLQCVDPYTPENPAPTHQEALSATFPGIGCCCGHMSASSASQQPAVGSHIHGLGRLCVSVRTVRKHLLGASCNVKKEELEKSLKDGTVLNVEEIAKREPGEQGSVGTV
ncbi:hypothetical protein OPT61_g2910 [Boeremia exigua]|uniref:Uncharacterized protein n=1 Tax=Boeremia exigua TaxID=749465 RepID=A0ACC2IJS7_9PLEO|nr:hypothetical protein OPT61_g2910 [Boeremia exigua]